MVSGVNTQSLHNFPIAAAGGWVRKRVCSAVECAMLANGCWKKQTGEGAQKRTLTRQTFLLEQN
ncbi:Uncharacterised protein [Chlamydia trachomatis]|nr:Uncharacterised protein [Chlamydia trachomatis]